MSYLPHCNHSGSSLQFNPVDLFVALPHAAPNDDRVVGIKPPHRSSSLYIQAVQAAKKYYCAMHKTGLTLCSHITKVNSLLQCTKTQRMLQTSLKR
jgi:hypothetical protein